MVIQRIGVLSLGKIVGAIYGGLGLIVSAFLTLSLFWGFVFSSGGGLGRNEIAVIIFLPLLNGTVGFIAGFLSGAIYNFAAGVLGGLRLEVRLSAASRPPSFF